MDEAVALVIAAPVLALALWAVTFVGEQSNSQARAAVAAEFAARASVDSGPAAADTAARTALGATLAACVRTDATLAHHDPGESAAVTVACEVPGSLTRDRVCVTGFAQARPATTGHVPAPCPGS